MSLRVCTQCDEQRVYARATSDVCLVCRAANEHVRQLRLAEAWASNRTTTEIAAELGVNINGLYKRVALARSRGYPMRPRRAVEGRVDNTLLREALERSSLTAGDVARELGPMVDGHKVKRLLGIVPMKHGVKRGGGRYRRRTLSEDQALLIADALGLDPHEIGC